MEHPIRYTRRERLALGALAVVAFLGINGTFVLGALTRPEATAAALRDPVALAFVIEALVLVAVFAYLFERWGVSRLGWGWFVALSLVGSLAFAVPVALLLPRSGGPESAAARR